MPVNADSDNAEPVDPADYLAINRANWDSRVAIHEQGYDLDRFRSEPSFLSSVVGNDVPLLGNLADLDVVHLQCHIGTDTLSLARLGARLTGLDLSPRSIESARRLAVDCGVSIEYVESDVYGAVEALGAERFDLVYTGVGALCWLPDIRRWAQVVADLLRPGGQLFIREGHPVLWALCDPRPDGLFVMEFPYFESDGTVFTETTTYVEHDGDLAAPTIVAFNHGIAEIFNALWSAGLTMTMFEEHRSLYWNAFPAAMEDDGHGGFRLRERGEVLPLSYTLRATKN